MAKNHKLSFRIIGGTASSKEIKEGLRKKGFRVRRVTLYSTGEGGNILFQKKEDKEACKNLGRVELENVTLGFETPVNTVDASVSVSGAPEADSSSDPAPATHPRLQVNERFFNPYHFVNVEGYVPRYPATDHDRFSDHCGKIDVEIEFVKPFFIPDPEKTTFIVSDETLKEENESQYPMPSVTEVISRWLQAKELDDDSLPLRIYFDPDCNRWNLDKPENYIWARAERNIPMDKVYPGVLRKNGNEYYITTNTPLKWAHKRMEFFKLNGRYAIPPTSIRGMLRNTVELLSNSCFSNVHARESKEYLFRRLDVSDADQSEEARKLQPVILKKINGHWRYLKLHQAKILSPHMFNRIGLPEENALGAYWNSDGYYEKVSVIGRNAPLQDDCTGLHSYHIKKDYRGEIRQVSTMGDIETTNYAVTKINGTLLNHSRNTYAKTFPYAGSVPPQEKYWAVVREREIETQGGGTYQIYKIKKLSSDLQTLEDEFTTYETNAINSESPSIRNEVRYAISEIRIKTSFDIDTKTQYRAFFIFGEKDFDDAVENAQFQGFGRQEDIIIERFRSLLRQRKENAKKLSSDKQGLNRWIRENLPDDIYNGMLAYYHPSKRYLTYTAVPQKPYKHSPETILERTDKKPCQDFEHLCPACNIFGTTPPGNGGSSRQATGYRGKVSVSTGKLSTNLAGRPRFVTIRPLSTPKPTYYPFYIMENRKNRSINRNAFLDYDSNNISIGRKLYLHHSEDSGGFADSSKTNLNSTIQPLPPGIKFQLRIDFENLSTYELGLLLYSLDMRYKGDRLCYHLGMGKPLGLGSCKLETKKVLLYEPEERYTTLDNSAKIKLTDEQINNLKQAYKYVQISTEEEEFNERKEEVEVNITGLPSLTLPQNLEDQYYRISYIKEFHFLRSLNVRYRLESICYAGGLINEGFKWYQEAKKHPDQGLFNPSLLENDLEHGRDVTDHALRTF